MKTFLVTGSASGLGACIAEQLALAGHLVVDFDRSRGHDVRDPMETFGAPPWRLDGLVNCAGVNKTAWLEGMTDELWDEVVDTNAKGIYKMTQWALPSLAASKGVVLNVVSDAAHKPMTTSLAYNASKGAAEIMTKQLAHELFPRWGIHVWGVAPNKLRDTGMSRDIEAQVQALRGWTPEYAAEYQRRSLALGAETEPTHLAQFIAWALSEQTRYQYWHKLIVPFGG